MDINSLNGANAYTNIPSSAPPVDNTQRREQNLEASRSELQSQNKTNQAFEVSITQEARDRLAAQTAENTRQTQQNTSNNTGSGTAAIVQAQNARQIVNIVA